MARPRLIEIDGKRYLWRDILALRRAQTATKEPMPTLFPVVVDARPKAARTAAERYRQPSLLDQINTPPSR